MRILEPIRYPHLNSILLSMLISLFVIGACSQEQTPETPLPDSWSEITIDDLHFIRAVLRENHPGPFDEQNPWFREWYIQGFQDALVLAGRVEDYAGYYFAIQYYIQGFQDGHLGALGEDLLKNEKLTFMWPGFVVGYSNGKFHVVESGVEGIPLGAEIIAADKVDVQKLGKTVLQKFYGLWSVYGARNHIASLLFVDSGNPFVPAPHQITVRVGHKDTTLSLNWETIDRVELEEKIRRARLQAPWKFDLRTFGEDGYWVSLPSFAMGDEDVLAGIDRIKQAISDNYEKIVTADILVIDVRGNGGGSSALGNEIVRMLWGEEMLHMALPRGEYTEWRASQDNTRFLRRVNLRRYEKRYGTESARYQSYERFIEELEAAERRNDKYYRYGNANSEKDEEQKYLSNPLKAKVFFLTDHVCFSACLDFADVILNIPDVVHIGLETKADAVYIDNRGVWLPSGNGRLGFSMKVYRNRQRGHNESYVPDLIWEGDIRDDKALEEWIIELSQTSIEDQGL